MTNREQMAAGLMIAMGMVLIWWVSGPAPESEPATSDAVVAPTPLATPAPPPSAPDLPPPSLSPGPMVEPSAPAGPAEEAMAAVAEELEGHLVRCPLPADAPANLRLGWHNTVQETGTISGLADEPAGTALFFSPPPDNELLQTDPGAWAVALRASNEPLGRLRWEGATSGSSGTCVLEEASTVEVRGVAEGYDPDAEQPLSINGCTQASQVIERDGRFVVTLWSGAPCTLELGSSGFGQWGTTIHPTSDLDGIVLRRMPPPEEPYGNMISELEAKLARAEQSVQDIEAGEDAYTRAIEAGVSPEAARQLDEWRATELAAAADQVEALQAQIPWWRLQQRNELKK